MMLTEPDEVQLSAILLEIVKSRLFPLYKVMLLYYFLVNFNALLGWQYSMLRAAIELAISTENGIRTILCERFECTSSGYVAIYHFDGGYNCVYRVEDMISATLVEAESIFNDMDSYREWRDHLISDKEIREME